MFKSYGKIEVKNGVRIICGIDICRYYQKLIHMYYFNTVKTQLPAHNAHITLANPKIHKGADYERAKKYIDKRVEFWYSPEDAYISRVNFWFPVKCDWAENIREELNIIDGSNWWGYHLTIANVKFNN
jgi:hypothetical protein